jgi:hypothetical protein
LFPKPWLADVLARLRDHPAKWIDSCGSKRDGQEKVDARRPLPIPNKVALGEHPLQAKA